MQMYDYPTLIIIIIIIITITSRGSPPLVSFHYYGTMPANSNDGISMMALQQ